MPVKQQLHFKIEFSVSCYLSCLSLACNGNGGCAGAVWEAGGDKTCDLHSRLDVDMREADGEAITVWRADPGEFSQIGFLFVFCLLILPVNYNCTFN